MQVLSQTLRCTMSSIFIYGLLVGASVSLAIFIAFYLGELKQHEFDKQRLQKSIYNRQSLYLGVLRREFFNGLLDLDTILVLDMELRDYAIKIKNMNNQDFNKEASLYLIKEYPQIYQFDMIGDTHSIKYFDVVNQTDHDLIKKYYLDIVKSKILLTRLENNSEFLENITNIDSVKEKIAEYEDERLGLLAYEAIRRKKYFSPLITNGEKYEDIDYIVELIKNTGFGPTIQLGIYIKKTEEHAIYEVFFSDSNDKIYEKYYRSNKDFSKTEPLITRQKLSTYT